MTSWQRRARGALLVFALLFSGAVYYSLRDRTPAIAPPSVERTDPKAVVEMTDATSELSKGLRTDFKINFARALTYEDGSTKFLEADIVVPERGGRALKVVAQEAVQKGEVDSADKPLSIDMKGQIRLATSDGLQARTEAASYQQPEKILRAPGAVSFTRERMSGAGVGATYDQERDVLWLLADATIVVKPDARGGGALNLRSGAAGLARRDRYMRLEGGAHIRRDHRTIESAEAMIYFHQTDDRIELMELRGGVRIEGSAGAAGGVREMAADAVNLSFAEDGQTLRGATLSGKAAIQLAGTVGQAGRRISADWLELGFAPDGSTVTQVSARDQVALEFPLEGDAPARAVRAARLEGTGEPGQGLTAARLAGSVEYRETHLATKTAAALDRQIRAESLALALAPGMGGINEARFSGEVRLRDGDLAAEAPELRYDLAAQSLNLTVPAGADAGARTRVTDRETTIEARRIGVGLDGRKMQADEDVRTQLRPSADRPQGKTPGILAPDAVVFAAAKQLAYDGAAGTAQYSGEARLWQPARDQGGGETAVQADAITLDRQTGNLTGTGNARSTMLFDDVDEATKAAKKVTAIARAAELVYDENVRRLTYGGDAHVTGPQGDLTAARIELYLGKTGAALDRVEAYEQVKVRLPDRVAAGTRLTYFSADARYVMHGEPSTVVDTLEKECRETTSDTLTFSRSTATISAGGNQKTRAQSKSGVSCPEPGVK